MKIITITKVLKCRFYLDDKETMKVSPGKGGFWEFGEFSKSDSKMFNPWASDGLHMAPFDREVSTVVVIS